ncbi:phosphoribosylaminoimidazolesuccinocarboxamide synthase, partial [Guyparkeria sp. 1SP6A2]|nr:phosphoribosylaminoimidazolesuccinocarboxamide synthase [Guyparkeria sp. 1SP6A2]
AVAAPTIASIRANGMFSSCSPRAARVRDTALALYNFAADHARSRGIIIADTKFEFGLDRDGRLTLIDEVLTPDSSRFWPADTYAPG